MDRFVHVAKRDLLKSVGTPLSFFYKVTPELEVEFISMFKRWVKEMLCECVPITHHHESLKMRIMMKAFQSFIDRVPDIEYASCLKIIKTYVAPEQLRKAVQAVDKKTMDNRTMYKDSWRMIFTRCIDCGFFVEDDGFTKVMWDEFRKHEKRTNQ